MTPPSGADADDCVLQLCGRHVEPASLLVASCLRIADARGLLRPRRIPLP
jgi:hypothetical protein